MIYEIHIQTIPLPSYVVKHAAGCNVSGLWRCARAIVQELLMEHWYEMLQRIDTYAAAHGIGNDVTRKLDWWLMETICKADEYNDLAADLGVPVKVMVIVMPTTPEAWETVSKEA
jgi:hypothetical protein